MFLKREQQNHNSEYDCISFLRLWVSVTTILWRSSWRLIRNTKHRLRGGWFWPEQRRQRPTDKLRRQVSFVLFMFYYLNTYWLEEMWTCTIQFCPVHVNSTLTGPQKKKVKPPGLQKKKKKIAPKRKRGQSSDTPAKRRRLDKQWTDFKDLVSINNLKELFLEI